MKIESLFQVLNSIKNSVKWQNSVFRSVECLANTIKFRWIPKMTFLPLEEKITHWVNSIDLLVVKYAQDDFS